MDIKYICNGITFTWDERKAESNRIKHEGITFKQASTAFFDPFLKVIEASRNNEIREAVIGLDDKWKMLFVVHIQIEDDQIRIISARQATKGERRDYED
jgi:uncharacterized DUF497 family protein